MHARTDEAVALLQQLIRNACVNDGTVDSGHEARSAATLRAYLDGTPLVLEEFEPAPGRTTLVARLEGTDPDAGTLCLLAHTDVVPADARAWRHDPFGGALVDGEVWGRGAVDMLNYVATMAVATRHVALRPARPRGTLLFVAVADEEAGGHVGAEWLVEHALDAVRCDWLLTEGGGYHLRGDGHGILVGVGQKGHAWLRVSVRGTPGHGSRPYRADNALVTAAEVVRRLAAYRPPSRAHDVWRRLVPYLPVPADERAALLDATTLWDALGHLPVDLARFAHSVTHTSISPNGLGSSGFKTNTIPGDAFVDVDVRMLPGETTADVDAMLAEALGDLAGRVDVEVRSVGEPTESPADGPLWDALAVATARAFPDAALAPTYSTAYTDAAHFRRAGITSYGFTLLSGELDMGTLQSRAHAHDERIDVASLAVATQGWIDVCDALLA